MIVYNIVHQDIGALCLSPAFHAYMATANIEEASPFCSLSDIADYNVKKWIQEVGNIFIRACVLSKLSLC